MTSKIYPLGFIDLETLGHDATRRVVADGHILLEMWHEIIDIGCVFADPETLEVLGEFEVKVRPKHPERCLPNIINHYPERAARGEWDNAVPLAAAVDFLFRECCKYSPHGVIVPGGQNFFFDWNFLATAFAWLGITEDEWKNYLYYKRFDISSMAIQELWKPEKPLDMTEFSLRSGLLQQTLGLKPEPEPHTAITGARLNHEVMKKLRDIRQNIF